MDPARPNELQQGIFGGETMCVFSDLALKGQDDEWYKAHPETKQILADMAKHEESVLTATYWSVLPYACGTQLAVKYRLRPQQGGSSQAPDTDENRLRTDLAKRLSIDGAVFILEIQNPRAGTNLPIDKATERWSETDAPFIPVARIEIARQDVKDGARIDGWTWTLCGMCSTRFILSGRRPTRRPRQRQP